MIGEPLRLPKIISVPETHRSDKARPNKPRRSVGDIEKTTSGNTKP